MPNNEEERIIITGGQSSQYFTDSGDDVYVIDCYFKTESSTNGGAISFCSPVDSAHLFVYSTTFNECKTSDTMGGAVYQYQKGKCTMKNCCYYSCYSTNTEDTIGQAMLIRTTALEEANLKIFQISDIYSTPVSDRSHESFNVGGSLLNINSINVSSSIVFVYGAVYLTPFATRSQVSASMIFCSIRNNTVQSSSCITFHRTNSKYTMEKTNILENHLTITIPLIYSSGDTLLESCTILDNSEQILAKTASQASIVIFNCTIDSILKMSGNVYTGLWEPLSQSFIIPIKLQNTLLCPAKYDVIRDLTPVIHPMRHICCTCKKFQQKIIFSTLFIFLL